jgi:Flp pilus assembly protein TadD
VEASDFAPAESLRYARFLLADGRVGPAESTVLDALRRAPRDLDLLTSLGEMHVRRGDWTRAREVVEDLRRLEGPDASHTADVLEVRILQAEGRPADMVAMLERRVAEGQADPEAMLGLARARLTAGDAETARAEVAKVLAEDPADEAGRLLLAQIHALEGETRAAEQLYRKLIAASPGSWLAYDGLFAVLAGIGRADEARAALDAGIAATGRDGTLLSTKVGLLVADGDFAGAIALLEELYARDTSNVVVANNLASLISTHRDDAESVERAFRIARRFRGSDNPYFQDTYGWILTRRGDGLQALAYLEPAAAALADDPLAQFRLGMTYLSLERPAAARMALARAIEIAGPDSPLPQIRTARQRIAEIDAAPPRASGG